MSLNLVVKVTSLLTLLSAVQGQYYSLRFVDEKEFTRNISCTIEKDNGGKSRALNIDGKCTDNGPPPDSNLTYEWLKGLITEPNTSHFKTFKIGRILRCTSNESSDKVIKDENKGTHASVALDNGLIQITGVELEDVVEEEAENGNETFKLVVAVKKNTGTKPTEAKSDRPTTIVQRLSQVFKSKSKTSNGESEVQSKNTEVISGNPDVTTDNTERPKTLTQRLSSIFVKEAKKDA